MKTISINIPEDLLFSIKIPRQQMERSLKKELALQLYREGFVSFANARRMAEMGKVEFHFLLGERGIHRQYDVADYEKDLENLAKWRIGE